MVERVLRTVAEELGRIGYAQLRVEDVATRSGVNKTTIYRRWPTKPELVAASLRELMTTPTEIDTGNLRADLRASLLEMMSFAGTPLGQGLMRTMQMERADPEVDKLTRELRREQRKKRLVMVERGIARGELPQGTDADFVVDLITAPVLNRAITFGDEVDAAYIDSVLDVVLAGFANRKR